MDKALLLYCWPVQNYIRWMVRQNNRPVKWPARSFDLIYLEFCFWGFMKKIVYLVKINNS